MEDVDQPTTIEVKVEDMAKVERKLWLSTKSTSTKTI